MKKRVIGLGGIFFKSKDAEASKDWYRKHLGIDSNKYGGVFSWPKTEDKDATGFTAWSVSSPESKHFAPSEKEFMFNYRVEDLEGLLKVLKEEGVEIIGEMESYEYGKFGWIMDNDGNKIELWEPVDEKLGGTPILPMN